MLRRFLFLLLFFPLGLQAQKTIKWNGLQLNAIDKKGRKQGDWLFFDKKGNALMQCQFQNDKVVGPRVFFNEGDTVLVRLTPTDSLEHFIYYVRGEKLSGAFVQNEDRFRIELDHLPEGFGSAELAELKRWYAVKIEPVYMFATQNLIDYFSAAYYKANAIPNWNHTFVVTINASGKVTHVECPSRDEIWTENVENEVYGMFYNMGRWQPFFDTWETRDIKITMSLGADLQTITSR